jgi:structure-specific recognition protein 1
MRFYIPGSGASFRRKQKSANKSEGSDAEGSEEEQTDDEQSAAQVFHDSVKEKAEISQVTGMGLVTFPEVLCTTPRSASFSFIGPCLCLTMNSRGRYDVDLYGNFLRLRNRTYDYKILYSHVQRLFMLPKTDEIHCLFVVS